MLLPISRLIYYITFWSFCQVFLKTFSNQLFQCDCHSEKWLNYYTTTCPICQVFFQKPFRLNCESSVLQTTYLLYHFRTILSSIFWTFFKKTSENLYSKVQKRLSEKVSVRQLYYYITIILICQPFFENFFKIYCRKQMQWQL